jgi:hypothetical protein
VVAVKGDKTDLEYKIRLNEIVSISIRLFVFILIASWFTLEAFTLIDHIHETKQEIQQRIEYYQSLENDMYQETF